MEIALAATSDFSSYTYTGKAKILFDDHHDEYEVDFVTNDQFKILVKNGFVTIIHQDAPKVKFTASITDPKYVKLMRSSTPARFEFVPTPKHPQYPFIPKLTFELIPHIYDYLNDQYFNGQCPKEVLFKKSTAREALGVAMYDTVRGRDLYRMLVNMKMIGSDMILFIDILLHEMIHLLLYRRGMEQRNREMVHDSHGPFFQAEMQRLNKLGFNVSIILDWEKRDVALASEYQVLVITQENQPKHAKYFWTTKNVERDFDSLVAQITQLHPTALYTIELVAVKNDAFKAYTQIADNGKLPKAKLKLWYDKKPVAGRVLKTLTVTAQSAVTANQFVKVPKAEEPYYALPLTLFSSWVRKNRINLSNDAAVNAIWIRFPIEKIAPFAQAELIEIHKALARGLGDADIKRRLTGVFARYDGRANYGEYTRTITAIIEKHKLDALLQYPQLGL